MATSNDGVSRFADSTIYSTTTFKNPITLGSVTTPSVGQLGYVTNGTNIDPNTPFLDGVALSVSSMELTAGTYILTSSYTPAIPVASNPTNINLNYSITPDFYQIEYGSVALFDLSGVGGLTESVLNLSGCIVVTNPVTLYLTSEFAFLTGTILVGTIIRFQAIKIA